MKIIIIILQAILNLVRKRRDLIANIKIGVPGIDKDIVLEAAGIDHFKSCLK